MEADNEVVEAKGAFEGGLKAYAEERMHASRRVAADKCLNIFARDTQCSCNDRIGFQELESTTSHL